MCIRDSNITFHKEEGKPFNYDWNINLKDIRGIALGNRMRFDDDCSFIILIISNQEPIYINLTYDTMEMTNFEKFLDLIQKEFSIKGDINNMYKEDDVVLIYTKELFGKQLYESRTSSFSAIINSVKRTLGFNHTISGIIRQELKSKFY